MWAAAEISRKMGAINAIGNSKRVSLTGPIPSGVSPKNRVITGIVVAGLRIRDITTAWTRWVTPAHRLRVCNCLPIAVSGFIFPCLSSQRRTIPEKACRYISVRLLYSLKHHFLSKVALRD